jgi:hypothetical protein
MLRVGIRREGLMFSIMVALVLSSTASAASKDAPVLTKTNRVALEYPSYSIATVAGSHVVRSESGAAIAAVCSGDCGDGDEAEVEWDISSRYRMSNTGGTIGITLPNLRAETSAAYSEAWCGSAESENQVSVLGNYVSVAKKSGIEVTHAFTEFHESMAEATESDFMSGCLPRASALSEYETHGPISFEIPFKLVNTDYVNVSTLLSMGTIHSGDTLRNVMLRLTVTGSEGPVECRVGTGLENSCTRLAQIGRGDHILIVEFDIDTTVMADDLEDPYSRLVRSGGFTAQLTPVYVD